MINVKELKLQCVEHDISIPTLAEKMKINKSSLYRKLDGKTEFVLSEILNIRNILNLNDSQVMHIFFN